MAWDPGFDLVEFYKDYGVPVVDRRVPSRPGPFSPTFFTVHHTASPAGSGDAPCLGICQRGRPDVAGPLVQTLLGRAGTVIAITNGRANHPGACDRESVERAMRGLPYAPPPGDDDKGLDTAGKTVGLEIENNGVGEPYPTVQIERVFQICEAWSREFGWDPLSKFPGHKTLTRRKIDPSFSMPWFWGELDRRIREGDDDMPPYTQWAQADRDALVADVARAINPHTTAEVGTSQGTLGSWIADNRLYMGSATYRVDGTNSIYLIREDRQGWYLVHVPSQAVLGELKAAGDLDGGTSPINFTRVVKKGSDVATWMASLPGWTGK